MELVELGSMMQRCRGNDVFSCEAASSGDAWLIVAKQPLLIRLKPKVYPSSSSTIMDSFSIHLIDVKDESMALEAMKAEAITLNIPDMSGILTQPERQAVSLSWTKKTPVDPHRMAWPPNNSQVFAMLTNTGHVLLWDANVDEILLNLTNSIIDHGNRSTVKLKNISESALVSAMCWSENIYKCDGNKFTYFVTALRNGTFHIWTVTFLDTWKFQIRVNLAYTFESNFTNVTSMYWIDMNDSSLLVYGNSSGQIQCSTIDVSKQSAFELRNSNLIGEELDNLAVEKIFHIRLPDGRICLIVVKISIVLTVVLDSLCESVLERTYHNLSNIRITGIVKMNETDLAISTLTGTIIHMKLRFDSGNKLIVSYDEFVTNVDFSVWGLHGISFTKNKLICLMYLTPHKTVNRKSAKVPSKIVFSYLKRPDYMNLVLNNDSKALTDYWDCLELARILNVKPCQLPTDWPVVFLDGMSPYETKVSMWLSIINSVEPEKNLMNNELFYLILFDHVKKSLAEYVENVEKVNELDEFQCQTIGLYLNFLQNYDGKIKRSCDGLVRDALEKFASILPSVEVKCDWCNENIKAVLCSQNHPRQWCCITLQEIDSVECLICPLCGSLAHPTIFSQNPICTFCDSYLTRNNLVCNNKEM